MQDGAVSGARTVLRSAVNAAMSNDISVQALAVARTGTDSAIDPGMAAANVSQPSAEPAPAASLIINPTLRLEPALGLVVIEFRNDSGAITTSIPSERQIEAYQRWEQTRLGPAHRAWCATRRRTRHDSVRSSRSGNRQAVTSGIPQKEGCWACVDCCWQTG